MWASVVMDDLRVWVRLGGHDTWSKENIVLGT